MTPPAGAQMYIFYLQEDNDSGGKFRFDWWSRHKKFLKNRKKNDAAPFSLDTAVVRQNTDGQTARWPNNSHLNPQNKPRSPIAPEQST